MRSGNSARVTDIIHSRLIRMIKAFHLLQGLFVILDCVLSKLLSWLLLVVILDYLLLPIRWLLRLAEGDGQQMVTDHDKPVNTGTLHNIACRAQLC